MQITILIINIFFIIKKQYSIKYFHKKRIHKKRKSINSSTRQPINSSTHQPINSSTHQLVNPSTRQLVNPSTHQLVNPSLNIPIESPMNLCFYGIQMKQINLVFGFKTTFISFGIKQVIFHQFFQNQFAAFI